ncbi:MAG: thermonuclease family protein [Deltaproteobacteria bacterium]|nr:thermonuclease family protein [Deltaproteobacteria bacterium]MBW2597137.1 thermonuclease family protein [Deltaproteobacteria bacterium]MBW2638581.1 thermonuclease family protein [Deltaproteobacteria bacterium]
MKILITPVQSSGPMGQGQELAKGGVLQRPLHMIHMINNRSINFVISFFYIFLFSFHLALADYADGYYDVKSVINGNTFELTDSQRVGLIGTDAPKTVEICSTQSTQHLKSLIEGKTVYLEKDVSETGSDGRLLRYIRVSNIFVNNQMMYDGYAYAVEEPPDTKYASQLISSEENARANKRGCLWYVGCTDCDDDDNKIFISCFIATAAYGSPVDPHVEILRKFRDNCLLANKTGEKFVHTYYKYSPAVADYIAKNEILRAMTRIGLLPIIGFSWIALKLGFIPAMTVMLLLIIGLAGLCKLMRKKQGVR